MLQPQKTATQQRLDHLAETAMRREAHRMQQLNDVNNAANQAHAAGQRPRSGIDRFKAQYRGKMPGISDE